MGIKKEKAATPPLDDLFYMHVKIPLFSGAEKKNSTLAWQS